MSIEEFLIKWLIGTTIGVFMLFLWGVGKTWPGENA